MFMPLDITTLPRKMVALRSLLLQREAQHTTEFERQANVLVQ